MKYIFGILLLLSFNNMANAACASYTSLVDFTPGQASPIINVVVEGYKIHSSHTVEILMLSLDYEGGEHTCKSVFYSKLSPTSEDDFIRDDALRMLKLGMSLGYILSFSTTTTNSSIVSINGFNDIGITLP
ncbi:MAG: hypothetical protein OEY52_07640 [Gammaproteobacteria bacterium]|nr:hypothetical protein [Gammaproteobacteria bacterium]